MNPKNNSKSNMNPHQDQTQDISSTGLPKQNHTLWYIQVLSFFGSVIAGMFFLFFLGILDLLDSDGFNTTLGMCTIIVVSVFSYLIPEETKESKDPVLLSFFLQGYALFFFGLDGLTHVSLDMLLIINIAFQIVFYFIFKNSIYKILAVIITFSSLLGSMEQEQILIFYPYLGAFLSIGLIYFSDSKRIFNQDSYLFYSLTLSFLGLFIFPHVIASKIDFSLIASFVFLILAIHYLIYESFKELSKEWMTIFISILLFLPLMKAPGILAAHIIIFIGFRNKSVFIANLGRLALIGYFFILYYQMEITLLQKSLYMLGSGVLFLFTYSGWVLYERKMESK